MTNSQKLDFSVVLPCLNEEQTIRECVQIALESAANAGYSIEVIVSDNGSSDSSVERAQGAGARIVNVPMRGYGAALDAGIRSANADYVVIADADLSYDLGSAKDFYLNMLENGNDLVVGNRFKGGISKGAMPKLHRYLGNPILSALARTFFQYHLEIFTAESEESVKQNIWKPTPKLKEWNLRQRWFYVSSKLMQKLVR
jgi:glycosyltransferase involved in cell wall biosynthesis